METLAKWRVCPKKRLVLNGSTFLILDGSDTLMIRGEESGVEETDALQCPGCGEIVGSEVMYVDAEGTPFSFLFSFPHFFDFHPISVHHFAKLFIRTH